MESIGKLLKEKRIELGLSIAEVSKKTKLPITHIKAIESGNVQFFEHDLSYLSYYIRHYANGVGVDFETLRPEVEEVTQEWTQLIEIKDVHKHLNEEKEASPIESARAKIKQKRRKVDYSFLAFVSTTLLLVFLLLFVGIKYLPKLFASDPIDKPPITNPLPTDPEKPNEEKPNTENPNNENPGTEKPDDEKPPVQSGSMEIVRVDDTHYEIKNWKAEEEFNFEVKFGAAETWILTSVDKKTTTDPQSKVYKSGETMELKETASKGKTIMFHFGKMAKNEVYFMNEKVELSEKTETTKGVVKLYFTFVEEGAE